MFNVGDKVHTGVFVCGEWMPVCVGRVVQIVDDQLINVDVMSLHGGAPWVKLEQASHCRPVTDE